MNGSYLSIRCSEIFTVLHIHNIQYSAVTHRNRSLCTHACYENSYPTKHGIYFTTLRQPVL